MSNRLFQAVVHQMTEAVERTLGVLDETGTVISCSELGRVGEVLSPELNAVFQTSDPVVADGYVYKSFGTHMHPEYAVFVEGDDELAQKYAAVLAVSLSSIKQYYDEKYDRGNFIKNVILDNILPGDIYLKARELRFNNEVTRVVILIRITEHVDISVFDVIQNLFPDKNKARSIIPMCSSVSALRSRASRIWRAPSAKRRWRWRSARCSTPKRRSSAMIISASPV